MSKNYESFGGNEKVVSTPIPPWNLRLDWSAQSGNWRYTVYGDEPHPELKRTGEMINLSGVIVNSHILCVTGRDAEGLFRLSSNFIRVNGGYQKFHVSKKFKRGQGKSPHRYTPGAWKSVEAEIKQDGLNGAFTRIIALKLSYCEARPWNPDEKKNEEAVKLHELYLNTFITLTGWAWRDGFQKSVGGDGLNVESLFSQTASNVVEKVQFGHKVKVHYPLFKLTSLGSLAKKDPKKADLLFEMGQEYQREVNQFLDDSAEFFRKISDREYNDDDDGEYTPPEAEGAPDVDDVPDEFKDTKDEEAEIATLTKTQKSIAKVAAEREAKAKAAAAVEKIVAEEEEDEDDDDIPF